MPWINAVVNFVTSMVSAVVTTIVESVVTSTTSALVVKIVTGAVYLAVTAALIAVTSMLLYMVTGADFFLDIITAAVAVITVVALVVGLVTASFMAASIVLLALVFPLYLLSLLYEGATGDDSLTQAISTGVARGVETTVDAVTQLVEDLWDGVSNSNAGSFLKWVLIGTGVYILYKGTRKPAAATTTIVQPVSGV